LGASLQAWQFAASPILPPMSNRHTRNWGVTAHSSEWTAIDAHDEDGDDALGGYGFVRVVEPGVVYFPPPLVEGFLTWAETPRRRGREFAMVWHEDVEPAQVRTLLDFHGELASRRATLAKDDPALRAFDEAVLQMVRLADRVHRAGGILGFLQPGSVLFCTLRDGRIQAVFPDVGFAFDDARGLREPRWIAEPELGYLCEEGPRKHNSASLQLYKEKCAGTKEIGKQAAAVGAAQAAEVRLLARLIAVALAGPEEVRRWCGDSRAFLKMPGRNLAPDTQAPIWDQVITPALLGGIKTCGELAQRLEATPPSEHFLFKPPTPPPWWKMAARRAALPLAAAATLMALGGLVYAFRDIIWPPVIPPPLCPKVAKSSPLYPRLFELVGMQTAALQEGNVRPYWDELKKCRELDGGGDCIPLLLADCAGEIEKSARQLLRDLGNNPVLPQTARKRIEESQALVQEAIPQVGEGDVKERLSLTARLLRMSLQGYGVVSPAAAPSSAEAPLVPR
jgi:hypothetical protein